jgi:hypothetical protein
MKITKRQLYKMIREAGRLSSQDIPTQADYDEMSRRGDYERDLRKDRRAEEISGPAPPDPPHALDRYDDVQWDEDGLPYRWDEKGNYMDLAHLMENRVKLTRQQLRRIIKEEKVRLLREQVDPYEMVMDHASRIFGDVPLDEEMDGNIIIVVEPEEAELKYDEWIQVFPDGIMIEDGIATGVYPE